MVLTFSPLGVSGLHLLGLLLPLSWWLSLFQKLYKAVLCRFHWILDMWYLCVPVPWVCCHCFSSLAQWTNKLLYPKWGVAIAPTSGEVGPKRYAEDSLVHCQGMVESVSSVIFYIYWVAGLCIVGLFWLGWSDGNVWSKWLSLAR